MTRRHTIVLISLLIACIQGFLCIPAPVWAASRTHKIVITPLEIHAAEDLSYLKKGIQDMLASRLAREGRVTVIRVQAPKTADTAGLLELARQQGADYILSGSITVLGGGVSTDAQVLDSATGKKVVSFGHAGDDRADIIEHVDQLAAAVNARLFGRTADSVVPDASLQSRGGAPVPVPPAQKDASIHQHPEKLLQQGNLDPETRRLLGEEEAVGLAPFLLRGRKFDGQVVSVAAGDVNGDGRPDIVSTTRTGNIWVQSITQGRWVTLAKWEGTGSYVGVDVADVNGNGKGEIFVTNFDNESSRLDSFVLELNGKSLQRIARRLNWYFRAVRLPDRGPVIVGQRQAARARFGSKIYEIVHAGDSYEAGDRISLPKDLNIFGFGYGQVRESQGPEVVAYNPNGYVRILNKSGKELWQTSARYGGSDTFLEFPDADRERGLKEFFFLNPRLDLVDIDQDGIDEILVVQNERDLTVMENMRFFKKGRLVWLKWNELGVGPVLSTPAVSRLIADFAVADFDGDGQKEVVAAVVNKREGIMDKGSSFLAVFGMSPQAPKPPQS